MSRKDQLPWYHGVLKRVETEGILNGKPPGVWLVRDSTTIPGDYVLSVSESGKVSHYIINNKGTMYTIGDQTFPDLPSIIEFYKKHFLDTTTLKEHVPNSECNIKVKALYAFPGKDDEDLPFKKGDILTVISKEEDNWWKARDSAGREGMIPKPYVQVLSNAPSATHPSPTVGSGPLPPGLASGVNGRKSMDYQNPPINRDQIPNDGFDYAIALMDRVVPYDHTQLTFKKGDIIKVATKKVDGSWFGELKNQSGWFPFSYVQEVSPHEQGRNFNGN
ncbi:predicted protein [Nematostella vectensis]|uniref:Crk-like protein n=1 Tax=Nematostella vectensis TaxID=45351 RepID=A7SCW1_NEMVE|nr:adapter molecule crk [Nematostella vectensis]EDO38500.1 predicted protein [Nematostella vectensis]|eukprot:XP_001630563.1 predicted protein [Nematostella vectensis]